MTIPAGSISPLFGLLQAMMHTEFVALQTARVGMLDAAEMQTDLSKARGIQQAQFLMLLSGESLEVPPYDPHAPKVVQRAYKLRSWRCNDHSGEREGK